MKELIKLFDFSYALGGGLSQLWLYAYMLMYGIYSFSTGIEDPLLAISILIFALAPLKPAFLMFVFYLLWENVTIFSFGVTAVSLMLIIMVVKLITQGKNIFLSKSHLQKRALSLQLLLLAYFAMMGLFSFTLYNNLTSINFIFKILATFYVISFMNDDVIASYNFKSIIHAIMFSSIIATAYGFYHETGVERWLAEMGGTVTQFYGTVGTTRMAFFYLIGMTFFLYYVDNAVLKYAGLIMFTILILMTVSLTAVILYVVVILIYMYSFGQIKKGLYYSFAVAAFAFVTFPVWSSISYVKPILYRMTYTMDAYEQGDVNAAVSGREEIQELYMEDLKESDMSTLLFGNARTARSATGAEMNSHSTYIDIIFYFGIVGILLLFFYQSGKIRLIRNKPYFFPMFTLKIIFLLGAASVSIMTSTYFMFLIFI